MALYQNLKLVRPTLNDPLMNAVYELNAGAAEHLRQGVNFDLDGQTELSIAEHERALEVNPQLVQAHINLILLYDRVGRPEKVEEHYRAALAVDPDSAENYYNYGVFPDRTEKV
ncbi:MAG: hypothetical protein WKF84_08600 [Pyrinomonadaceae bacterium]